MFARGSKLLHDALEEALNGATLRLAAKAGGGRRVEADEGATAAVGEKTSGGGERRRGRRTEQRGGGVRCSNGHCLINQLIRERRKNERKKKSEVRFTGSEAHGVVRVR